MSKITALAPAKLNLFLEVLDKRPDGYHNISSVMQSVSLYDKISGQITDSKNTEIFCSNDNIPDGEKNIAFKAASAFFEYTDIINPGVVINIDKNIPSSAGLAGGSSNAAVTLKILNELFKTGLNIDQLNEISKQIGADVPFCLVGGTYFCEGIGEILTPLPDLKDCIILLALSNSRISTPDAYSKIDKLGDRNTVLNNYKKIFSSGSLVNICKNMFNVFENIVPECKFTKDIMMKSGALGSLMSGSGPTVFGIFDNKRNVYEAINSLSYLGYKCVICKPIKSNPGLIKRKL